MKDSTLIKIYAIILINVKLFKIGEIGIMKTALEKYAQTLKGYSADYGRLAVELDDFRLRLTAAEEGGVWHETKKIFGIYCKALATLTDLEVRMIGYLPSTNARRRVLEPLEGYVMPLEPLKYQSRTLKRFTAFLSDVGAITADMYDLAARLAVRDGDGYSISLAIDLCRLIDFLTSECLYAFDFSKGDKAAEVIENVRRTSRDPAKELLDHLLNGTPLTTPSKAAPEPQEQEEHSQTEEEKAAIEQEPLFEFIDVPKADAPKAKNGWGGRRAGSGQKKIVGAKRCTFMLTEEQAEKVKAFVKQLRSGKLD